MMAISSESSANDDKKIKTASERQKMMNKWRTVGRNTLGTKSITMIYCKRSKASEKLNLHSEIILAKDPQANVVRLLQLKTPKKERKSNKMFYLLIEADIGL